MSTERLSAAVKTRVSTEAKQALKAEASRRHLDVADIVREALREYLAKREVEQKPATAEQSEAA